MKYLCIGKVFFVSNDLFIKYVNIGQYSAYNGFVLILEKILIAFKKIQFEYSVYWKSINNLYA